MSDILLLLLIYFVVALPFLIIEFFIVSIIKYFYAIHKNKKQPGKYSNKEIKKRLIFLIVSSVILAILVWCIVEIIIILNTPVAFM